MRRVFHFLLQVLVATALGSAARAQVTWGLTGGGNWNVNTNWSSGTFPNAVGAAAVLGTSITNNSTISLGENITVGSIVFNDNNNYVVTNNTLVFNTGGPGAATILVTNTGGPGAHTIGSTLQLTSNLVVSQWSTGLFTMSGSKSGAGGLTKEGTGTLGLSGAATYLGATVINDGRINYNSGGAIPGGPVTVGDGAGAAGSAVLFLDAGIGVAQALAPTLGSDGLLIQGPNRLVRLLSASGTGELRLNGPVPQGFQFIGDGASNNSTYSGVITGGAVVSSPPNFNGGSRINKSGTATLTLDGNSSYISPTFVSGGALRAASSNALGAAGINNATYVFSAGALELAGNVSIAEPLFLNGQGDGAGALRSVSGSNTVTGALSIGWTGTGVTNTNASLGAAANSTLVIGTQITSTNPAIGLTKYGAGTVILTTNSTYSGSTIVDGGTLRMAASSNAVIGNVQVATAGTLLYSGNNQIANTAALSNAGVVQLGTNSDTVASFTMSSGSIQGTGTLTAPTVNLTGGTVNAFVNGTTLTKTGSGTATIAAGRIVTVSNSTVSAGDLRVSGTLAGTTTVTNSGTISGNGTVSTLNINNGGTLSPGDSPGILTATNGASWNQGGSYDWEIFSLADSPGVSWDLLDVTGGTLNLTGITTPGGFTINLITLLGDGVTPGALTGFNPLADYNNWLIARAPSILGFNAASFLLDSSDFVGAAGVFGIEQRTIVGGEGIYLTYTHVVPEPGTWAAGALLAMAAAWSWHRRQRAGSAARLD